MVTIQLLCNHTGSLVYLKSHAEFLNKESFVLGCRLTSSPTHDHPKNSTHPSFLHLFPPAHPLMPLTLCFYHLPRLLTVRLSTIPIPSPPEFAHLLTRTFRIITYPEASRPPRFSFPRTDIMPYQDSAFAALYNFCSIVLFFKAIYPLLSATNLLSFSPTTDDQPQLVLRSATWSSHPTHLGYCVHCSALRSGPAKSTLAPKGRFTTWSPFCSPISSALFECATLCKSNPPGYHTAGFPTRQTELLVPSFD